METFGFLASINCNNKLNFLLIELCKNNLKINRELFNNNFVFAFEIPKPNKLD